MRRQSRPGARAMPAKRWQQSKGAGRCRGLIPLPCPYLLGSSFFSPSRSTIGAASAPIAATPATGIERAVSCRRQLDQPKGGGEGGGKGTRTDHQQHRLDLGILCGRHPARHKHQSAAGPSVRSVSGSRRHRTAAVADRTVGSASTGVSPAWQWAKAVGERSSHLVCFVCKCGAAAPGYYGSLRSSLDRRQEHWSSRVIGGDPEWRMLCC